MSACEVHRYHSPRPQDIDRHHIWPVFLGGPDTESNLVVICPTGHRNIHELLREYLHARGVPSWEVRREYGPQERALAARGWQGATSVPESLWEISWPPGSDSGATVLITR